MPLPSMSPASKEGCSAARYEFIEYGGYRFFAFANTKINLQTVQSEDDYATKLVKCTFECEFILSTRTVEAIELGSTKNGVPAPGTDHAMDVIRETLNTPGLPFKIAYRGAGKELNFYDTSDNNAHYIVPTMQSGPFTDVIGWEPLGQFACRCQWRVIVHYPPQVPYTVTDRIQKNIKLGLTAPFYRLLIEDERSYFDYLSSFNEEYDVTINEAGAIVMTTLGEIEFEGILPDRFQDPAGMKDIYSSSLTRERIRCLTHLFRTTIPVGFKRTQKYRYNKNNHSISYVITDTEIESDNPLHPFILRADVTHEVSSSLMNSDVFSGSGFLTWKNNISGSFEVRPGAWKGWAYVAFSIILRQRMDRATQFSAEDVTTALDSKDSVDGEKKNNDIKKITNKYLVLDILIREHLYSRQVELSVSYLLVTPLKSLLEMSGLFFPVDTKWIDKSYGTIPAKPTKPDDPNSALPHAAKDQWELWKCNTLNYENIFGYRNVNLPDHSLIFAAGDTNIFGSAESFVARRRSEAAPQSQSIKEMPRTKIAIDPNTSPPPFDPLACEELIDDRAQGKVVDEKIGQPNDEAPLGSGQNKNKPYQDGPGNKQSKYFNGMDPSISYIAYANNIEVEEDTHCIYLPKVDSRSPSERRNTSLAANDRYQKGFVLHGSTQTFPTKYDQDDPIGAQVVSKPTYKVITTGHAIRAGWPASPPVLLGAMRNTGTTESEGILSASVVKAYRSGKNRVKHLQIGQTDTIPIYLTLWEIEYSLDGDPRCTNTLFVTNQNSEFA